MYEKRTDPLLPPRHFWRRVTRHGVLSLLVVAASLAVGTTGYRLLEHMTWIDAFLNASMILSGMGPAGPLATPGGKLFAALYALYSGLVLIAVTAILIAPFVHRLLHHLHSDSK
jgi:hypothetical protein